MHLLFLSKTIIDVGVLQEDTYELMTKFKSTQQLITEPITEWNQETKRIYSAASADFELLNVAALDFNGMMIETSIVCSGEEIMHARLTDKKTGEKGYRKTPDVDKLIVVVGPRYFRPTEVETLLGDPAKVSTKLGWEAKSMFSELVKEIGQADFEAAKRDELVTHLIQGLRSP